MLVISSFSLPGRLLHLVALHSLLLLASPSLYWLLGPSGPKKSDIESSRRSRTLLPTHQPGDDLVLVCLFPSWFLEQRDQGASTVLQFIERTSIL